MLRHLQYRGDNYDRKLRLFACACCRRIWEEIPDSRSQNAVEMAERYADGFATEEEMNAASHMALDASDQAQAMDWENAANAAYSASACGISAFDVAIYASVDSCDVYEECGDNRYHERIIQAHILRDIVGNPFKPRTFQTQWKTQTIIQLSQSMYDDRDFTAMSILGDALEEAGCTNEEILRHCRERDLHVRGCWLVDLVLGKE